METGFIVLEYDENEWTRARMKKTVIDNRASNGGSNFERISGNGGMALGRFPFRYCFVSRCVAPKIQSNKVVFFLAGRSLKKDGYPKIICKFQFFTKDF
jgi:hypothetical protein